MNGILMMYNLINSMYPDKNRKEKKKEIKIEKSNIMKNDRPDEKKLRKCTRCKEYFDVSPFANMIDCGEQDAYQDIVLYNKKYYLCPRCSFTLERWLCKHDDILEYKKQTYMINDIYKDIEKFQVTDSLDVLNKEHILNRINKLKKIINKIDELYIN